VSRVEGKPIATGSLVDLTKIVLVGQTPPPHGGQAIIIERMLSSEWNNAKLFHIRMSFMKSMEDRAKPSARKIFHLLEIIFRIIISRFKTGARVLYFPPGNSPRSTIYRDLILLACTRPFFSKTILHFHAAGISDTAVSLKSYERLLIRMILGRPDLTITSSEFNPKDGEFLHAKRNVIIPLGLPDIFPPQTAHRAYNKDGALNLLFLGLMNGTKGEGRIVEALGILRDSGRKIKLRLAGSFETKEYEDQFWKRVNSLKLSDVVEYLGVVSGQSKMDSFLNSDILCFPSTFQSESFGVVLIEGMQAYMPLIATRWRGIQSAIKDGETGFLVSPDSPQELASKIAFFSDNPNEIAAFGRAGNVFYHEKFTWEKFIDSLNSEFKRLA